MMERDRRLGMLVLVSCCGMFAITCAPRTARLYSVDTASAPLELRYKGGKAWIGEQANPACQGEYRTSVADIWGSGLGSAVLACQNGRVLECEFQFSGFTGQGTGTCVDNEQRRYRVLF